MPEIKIGEYLFQRLRQLGIKSILGVPGDYELALLDYITPESGLQWRGNPNELVASYAADGYARIAGAAAYITTFGPGELSAYCGMAGHYCEFVPALHIVGYPPVSAEESHAIMHHTLGDGRFDMFEKMAKEITVDTVIIRDPKKAAEEIDRVLTTMKIQSRPVYLGLPTDRIHSLVSDERLKQPLDIELPSDDPEVREEAVDAIRSLVDGASNPVIIVDGNTARNDAIKEAEALVQALKIPYFVTAMGKGFNESLPTYGGMYGGGATFEEVKPHVESSDAILYLGRFPSDFNTGEFTMKLNESAVVDFQRFSLTIGGNKKFNAGIKQTLNALAKSYETKPHTISLTKLSWNPYPLKPEASGALTQDFLWDTMGSFFQPGDFIIGETGTSSYGLTASKLPAGAAMYNQTIFGSIGYATGAAVGAAIAAKDTGAFKRVVLVTGEGSMHLTVQAFGDLLRYGLKPIVFVLNNDGYTIERLIHGKTAEYNDVARYDYSLLAKTFGPDFLSKYHGPIKTAQQLVELVESGEARGEDALQLVELVLDRMDAPTTLKLIGAAVDEFNKPKEARPGKAALGA